MMLLSIFSNTGTVSFIIYGLFILITIIAMFVGFHYIRKGNLEPAKLEKMIEIFKYTIVTVAISTVTLVITDLFREREQDLKEIEYFDKYVEDVKVADNIQSRLLLSKYFSIVSPSGELKKSWKEYYDTLKVEYDQYFRDKKEKERLDTIKNPTEDQIIQKERITDKVQQKETPLASSYSKIKPIVYIQISEESQRQIARSLQIALLDQNFLAPGIENIGKKVNVYVPAKTEVRYFREEELTEAKRLITIIKSQNIGLPINEDPQKVQGSGRGTRPGLFEIWFSKPN